MDIQAFKEWVWTDAFERKLEHLYGLEQLEKQRIRYLHILSRFQETFPESNEFDVFSASGRIEVGGNHTDHQLGRVLAMAVDLDTVAFVRKNDDNVIRLVSKDYEIAPIELSDLTIHEDEYYTTMGIIRGLANYFYEIHGMVGGFDAYVESNVFSGSGLSSSASVEVLIAKILDYYYGSNKMTVSDYAIISQKAENNYFNKPCGLMDQMVIAHGGFCAIDFYDKDHPVVNKVNSHGMFDDIDICLVQSGGSHADLSEDYAEIFRDCKALSQFFNEAYLSRVKFDDFYQSLDKLNEHFDTRVILRGYHFFKENNRVLDLMDALNKQDLKAFLNHILASGNSSYHYLQNVLNPHDHKQGLALALMMAENHLTNTGAWRVHGGGFAGTSLMFVPKRQTAELKVAFEKVFGEGSFIQIRLREDGVIHVI
ncbi:MAG TPA: galactokinase family protein [Erysipelotrichaceae bacterium]|nr:galactokinase family protein [Erysipelotrichaceae bacterium]